MLKFIQTKDIKYKGKVYKGRKIIGTEETLELIYPLIDRVIFTSGWRSKKEQKVMVDKGVSKTMDSNHCRGVAYDVWNWKESEKEMRKAGFNNDIYWDKFHFPFGGEGYARKNFNLIAELPKNLIEFKPTTPKQDEIVPIPVKVIKTPPSSILEPTERSTDIRVQIYDLIMEIKKLITKLIKLK